MELSSSSSDDQNFLPAIHNIRNNNANITNNLTACSINVDKNQKELTQFSKMLKQFYEQKLKREEEFKLDDFQNQSIFDQKIGFFKPVPNLFFLPYTILLKKIKDFFYLRDNILDMKYPNLQSCSLNFQKKSIDVKIHSNTQLFFYTIKKIQCQSLTNHKLPTCMQRDLIIDKLFEYYIKVYKEFYVQEVIGLILYWAYQKRILSDQYISQKAWKIIIIFLYINAGYNILNVMDPKQYPQQNQKKLQKIKKFAYVDKKGDCQLSSELYDEINYSLRQRKGFYCQNKRKQMYLKQIYPIYFPLNQKQIEEWKKRQSKQIQKVLQRSRNNIQKMSNISIGVIMLKFFKFLHDDFNKYTKTTIDLKEKCVKEQPHDKFCLEVLDPVFGDNLTKQFSSFPNIHKVRLRIKQAYETLKNDDPADAFCKIFESN